MSGLLARKNSFSLSSLAGSPMETPEQGRNRAERPYNSLTRRTRKDIAKEQWRHSWGHTKEENKDDFWAALKSHYNYLMDNQLIESCKEANGELLWDDSDASFSCIWSSEFMDQYNELYMWLNGIQEAVYGTEENVTDKNLRMAHLEEMQKNSFRLKQFVEQSQKLLRRYPSMSEEIGWRVTHLNSKWESLEQAISPKKGKPDEPEMYTDVEHEVRCLRKWLREMEARLLPLNFRPGWTLQYLEEKAREHQACQRDIESHGKIVTSVLKLCERLSYDEATSQRYDTEHARKVGLSLERRWHQIWLRSLEWQCLLEELIAKYKNGGVSDGNCSCDSDEEPLTKYPRLGGEFDARTPVGRTSRKTPDDEGEEDALDDLQKHSQDLEAYIEDDLETLCMMDTDVGLGSEASAFRYIPCAHVESSWNSDLETTEYGSRYKEDLAGRNKTDRGVMVGPTGITELKANRSPLERFEVIQDVGYSSESSAHMSNDERGEIVKVYAYNATQDNYSLVIQGPSVGQDQQTHVSVDDVVETKAVQSVSGFEPSNNNATSPVAGDSGHTSMSSTQSSNANSHTSLSNENFPPLSQSQNTIRNSSLVQPESQVTDEVDCNDAKTAGPNPNCATFYFKHLDTDSEFESRQEENIGGKAENSQPDKVICNPARNGVYDVKSGDTTSEEEWTYEASDVKGSPCRVNNSKQSDSGTPVKVRLTTKRGARTRLDFGTDSDSVTFQNQTSVSEQLAYNTSDTDWLNSNIVSDSDLSAIGFETAQEILSELESCRRTSQSSTVNTSDTLVPETEVEMASLEAGPESGACGSKKDSIQRLVNEAEQLVREDKSDKHKTRQFEPLMFNEDSASKSIRVKEWLKLHPMTKNSKSDFAAQVVDSCDASGEYTTGESDADAESMTSEEQNSSVVTCRQRTALGLAEGIQDNDATPVAEKTAAPFGASAAEPTVKVVLRSKKQQKGDRPWSMLELCHLTNKTDLAHFSISETALNKLLTPTGGSNPGFVLSIKPEMCSVGVQKNLSSPSMESSTFPAHGGLGSSTGSLRRKKIKTRRRMHSRKTDSGSDGVTLAHSGSENNQKSPLRQCQFKSHSSPSGSEAISSQKGIVKSRSFSGSASRKVGTTEKYSSEPGVLPPSLRCGQSSESEAEEAVPLQRPVHIRIDSDREPSLTHAEEMSSYSEQAWDNYQTQYPSEPYSDEPLDQETARKLLEFGDDYRNFIDSHSDCTSSLSEAPRRSSWRRTRPQGMTVTVDSSIFDSDSDLEDLHCAIEESRSQLSFAETMFQRHLDRGALDLNLAGDYAQLVATCRENIKCMCLILGHLDSGERLLSLSDCREVRGIVQRWEMLQGQARDRQRSVSQLKELQRDINDLKKVFLELTNKLAVASKDISDSRDLEKRIQDIKGYLALLNDKKAVLLALNVSVHSFLADSGTSGTHLKEDVTELYRLWDDLYNRSSGQLTSLQAVSQMWYQFESQYIELQKVLKADQETLQMLNTAISTGSATNDVAVSVRCIARALSERQKPKLELAKTQNLDINDLLFLNKGSQTSVEGSLSDSGISDSGSEQELSERERHLVVLRQLARDLESALSPGSAALTAISKNLDQAADELKGLQQTCRDLIVKTAAQVEGRRLNTQTAGAVTRRKNPSATRKASGEGVKIDAGTKKPKGSSSWLWRVLRAAFPFQLSLVVLLCLACLLEPHCCDNLNNLNLSFTPQLRYIRGPPPV